MHRIPDDQLHLPKYASNNQNAIHIGSTQDASGAMRQKTTKPKCGTMLAPGVDAVLLIWV